MMNSSMQNGFYVDSYDGPLDLVTPQVKLRRRSSFFKLKTPVEDPSAVKVEKVISEAYMKQLEKETDEWKAAFDVACAKSRAIKAILASRERPVYDASILSEERQSYLTQDINVSDYLKQCEEFSRRVLFYTKQKEWTQMRLEYARRQVDDRVIEQTIEKLSASPNETNPAV